MTNCIWFILIVSIGASMIYLTYMFTQSRCSTHEYRAIINSLNQPQFLTLFISRIHHHCVTSERQLNSFTFLSNYLLPNLVIWCNSLTIIEICAVRALNYWSISRCHSVCFVCCPAVVIGNISKGRFFWNIFDGLWFLMIKNFDRKTFSMCGTYESKKLTVK